ncbi:phage integrase [Escherichia coli]|nr:phage integrase [Escherichia coli]
MRISNYEIAYQPVLRPEEVRVLNLRVSNRDLTCISGMFTALIEAELFFGEHPIRGTKRLKEEKPDTGYLTQEEIALLLAALDGDNKKRLRFFA